MDAMELYKSYRKDMSDKEVTQLCQDILEASGDRAMTIARAKHAGWWNDNVADPYQAISNAPGDQCRAMGWAVINNWWKKDDVSNIDITTNVTTMIINPHNVTKDEIGLGT